MSPNESFVTDAQLKRALSELAAGPDGLLLAGDVMQVIELTPQRAGPTWSSSRMVRVAIVAAIGMLLLALAGTAALLSDTVPAPDSRPETIVVGLAGGTALGIDPQTAEVVELGEFTLPDGYGPEGLVVNHPDGTTTVYSTSGTYASSPDESSRAFFDSAGTPEYQPPGLSVTHLGLFVKRHQSDRELIVDMGDCYCMAQYGVAWSPDGQWLAFTKPDRRSGLDAGLYVVRADGSDLRLLQVGEFGRPAWLAEVP